MRSILIAVILMGLLYGVAPTATADECENMYGKTWRGVILGGLIGHFEVSINQTGSGGHLNLYYYSWTLPTIQFNKTSLNNISCSTNQSGQPILTFSSISDSSAGKQWQVTLNLAHPISDNDLVDADVVHFVGNIISDNSNKNDTPSIPLKGRAMIN